MLWADENDAAQQRRELEKRDLAENLPPRRHRTRLMRLWLALGLPLLLLSVGWAGAARAQENLPPWHAIAKDGGVRVHLYVFWASTCPHCHRALRFLGALEEELPWLEVQALEISAPENANLYAELAEQLGTDARYVPAFFYCGRSFQGYDDDATTGRFLQDSLRACHAELVARTSMNEPPATEDVTAVPGSPSIAVPLIGELDPSAFSLPVLTLVLAGLDAFNPCAFFVLLFLLSLMAHARSRARMTLVGCTFVLFSGLLYFVFMAAWLNLFLIVGYLPLITAGAGLVAVVLGLVNIKDFVWLNRGISLSIPERAKPGLYQRMGKLVGAANLPAMLAAHRGPRARRECVRAALHRRPAAGVHAHPDPGRTHRARLLRLPGVLQCGLRAAAARDRRGLRGHAWRP